MDFTLTEAQRIFQATAREVADQAVKVQLFRFIDVLPQLQTAEATTSHLREYFEEARDIGDPAVLAEIATQCGVNGWPEKSPDVSALEEEVRAMGITAVPTFIFDRRSGISGAYPAETLAGAIREASGEALKKR